MSLTDTFYDNVSGNIMSAVICSETLTVSGVLDLLSQRYNRIWCGMKDRFSAEDLFSVLESRNDVSFADTKTHQSDATGIVVSSIDIVKNKMLESFEGDNINHIEFADVIVIDGI